jgi:tripartite-type tricarboxylate transporter receptor subunit TctC
MKSPHLNRRIALLGAITFATGAAFAQQNNNSIRLMVGYAAGGPVDQTARIIGHALAKELDTPVMVENKTGANAMLAGDAVAKGKPDGTILWFAASPTITISPNVMKKMSFDPAKDLTPLAPVLSYYNVLVVNKDTPFQSVKDLTDYARMNPGKLTYGSAGTGGSNHLCGELFADRTHTKLNHIPYKGNAPAMTDVIGGQITMMFDIVGSARPFISSGKVRALAVTSPHRNPSLPNVPTMAESGLSGLAGFDVGGWYGIYAPPGAPAALVTRYNQAINKVLAQPEVKEKLEEMGYELWSGAPKLLADRGNKDRAMWATVTKGIEIE